RLAVPRLADDAHPLDRRLQGLGLGLACGRGARRLPFGVAELPVVIEIESSEERALILLPLVELRERRGARVADLRVRAQLAHDAQLRSDPEQALGVAPVARVQQGNRIRGRADRAGCRAVPDVAYVRGDLGRHRPDEAARPVVADEREELDARAALDAAPAGVTPRVFLLLLDLVRPPDARPRGERSGGRRRTRGQGAAGDLDVTLGRRADVRSGR